MSSNITFRRTPRHHLSGTQICGMRTDFPGGYLCQVGSDYRTLPYGSWTAGENRQKRFWRKDLNPKGEVLGFHPDYPQHLTGEDSGEKGRYSSPCQATASTGGLLFDPSHPSVGPIRKQCLLRRSPEGRQGEQYTETRVPGIGTRVWGMERMRKEMRRRKGDPPNRKWKAAVRHIPAAAFSFLLFFPKTNYSFSQNNYKPILNN